MIFKKITSFFQKNYIQRFPELAALSLFVFATIEFASLLSFSYISPEKNVLGLFGYLSGIIWYFLFGPVSFLGIGYLYLLSWNWWHKKYHSSHMLHCVSFFGALVSLCLLVCLVNVLFPGMNSAWHDLIGISPISKRVAFNPAAAYFPTSGFIADFLYKGLPYGNFELLFSIIGTALISSTMLFVSLTLLFDINLKALVTSFLRQRQTNIDSSKDTSALKSKENELLKRNTLGYKKDEEVAAAATAAVLPTSRERKFPDLLESQKIGKQAASFTAEKNTTISKKLSGNGTGTPLDEKTLRSAPPAFLEYPLPSIDLLHESKKIDLSNLKKELKEKADLLEETLMSFGIEAKVGQIHCGPTVTLFEVHPAVGVKIGKIKTLENDIALNMEAKSIRIIAPIPGKAAVGIEVPNQIPQEVSFREVISTYIEQGSTFKIPMLLGKAVNGELVMTDLAKMPHCIIAGATGSGKSVCINSIVMSILMLARPEDIRLLMIDPKKVELTPYTNLPHMLAPVITEPHDAAQALNWLVREMEKRYEILKLTGQRNIDSFNKRKRNIDQEASLPFDIPEKLSYYVAIIDELADLMMVSSQDIETPIARIAQMARAVGIHLILATQRPSREVITGLIKANFPSRISFKVASRINSQIIIDDIGAETLLGNGDMLFLLPGSSQLVRCQGVYVRDEEIAKVIEDITSKRPPEYVIQSFQKQNENSFMSGAEEAENLDSLFHEAKEVVFATGNASTTFLQRKLKIGYARAASIMDQLEDHGIVGPQEGARPRKIFFPKKAIEEEDTELDDLSLEADSEEFPLSEELQSIEAPHTRDVDSPFSSVEHERFNRLRDIASQYPRSTSDASEEVENEL